MNHKTRYSLLFCFFSFVLLTGTWAQKNLLDKKITVDIDGQSLEQALEVISYNARIHFSYNSDIIPVDSVVTIHSENKEVKKVLNQLLEEKFTFQTTGQHVIIQPKKYLPPEAKTGLSISGIVTAAETGLPLAQTSVYQVGGKEGVLSDTRGFFMIMVEPDRDEISLAVSRQQYRDTIIFVSVHQKSELRIPLVPEYPILESAIPQLPSSILLPEVEQSTLVPKMVGGEMMTHARNINYSIRRFGQVSFLPFAGTNYKLSGSIDNKVSLNILSGYAYGVSGIELGGLLNINRKQVHGLQLAGFGNITGDRTGGVQMAGFFNHNFGNVKGLQVSGFYNAVQDTLYGVQLAGFANVLNGKIRGAQVAGFTNITTSEVDASQLSGFLNIALKDSRGIQAAGFANHTHGNQTGVQASGFSNTVKGDMEGVQLAGFSNVVTKDVKGVQVAGFLNYARKVKGVQVGVINIADTVSIASIGVVNLIRKGFHEISIYSDEMGSAGVNLGLGTYRFYGIVGVSAQPFSRPAAWSLLYGAGTRFMAQKKISMDMAVSVRSVNVGRFWDNDPGEHYKLNGDINMTLSKNFSLSIGPSVNFYTYSLTRTQQGSYPENFLFKSIQSKTLEDYVFKFWCGVSAGVKLQF